MFSTLMRWLPARQAGVALLALQAAAPARAGLSTSRAPSVPPPRQPNAGHEPQPLTPAAPQASSAVPAASAHPATPAPAPGPQAEVDALADIAGLDTARGLSLAGGQAEAYLRGLRQFIMQYSRGFGEIEQALLDELFIEPRRMAHSLRGACGLIGATTLHAAAGAAGRGAGAARAGRRGGRRRSAARVDRAKLVKEIKGWAFTILAVLAFRTFLYEAVYIPSGSMIPTLQIGDYVIVEKWAYGARLPFTATAQATWSTPKRGDIVVLLAPPGNPRDDDLIKRVVGVDGDTVEIRDGHLVVNGVPVPRERVPGPCGGRRGRCSRRCTGGRRCSCSRRCCTSRPCCCTWGPSRSTSCRGSSRARRPGRCTAARSCTRASALTWTPTTPPTRSVAPPLQVYCCVCVFQLQCGTNV